MADVGGVVDHRRGGSGHGEKSADEKSRSMVPACSASCCLVGTSTLTRPRRGDHRSFLGKLPRFGDYILRLSSKMISCQRRTALQRASIASDCSGARG